MSLLHKILGIRVSETDKTRYTKSKEKSNKLKKVRKFKWFWQRSGNKSSE